MSQNYICSFIRSAKNIFFGVPQNLSNFVCHEMKKVENHFLKLFEWAQNPMTSIFVGERQKRRPSYTEKAM